MSLMPKYVVLLLLLVVPFCARAQVLQDDALKAVYLVNFYEFVAWPNQDFTERRIAVLGAPKIADRINKIALDREGRSEGAALKAVVVNDKIELQEYQIVFVAKDWEHDWGWLNAQAELYGLLLVGEQKDFISEGGVIQFFMAKNRLHFGVNNQRAGQLNIRLSSKLLELAEEVRQR